jgi:hypothetical protein
MALKKVTAAAGMAIGILVIGGSVVGGIALASDHGPAGSSTTVPVSDEVTPGVTGTHDDDGNDNEAYDDNDHGATPSASGTHDGADDGPDGSHDGSDDGPGHH